MRHRRHRSGSTSAALRVALCAVVLVLACAGPASALVKPTITMDQETGGQLTRFTIVTNGTETDASVSSMDFIFPEGFDASQVKTRVTILEGMNRIPVTVTGGPKDRTVSLAFDPAVPPNSTLRVELYDVMTAEAGGEYPLRIEYSAEATVSGVPAVEKRVDESLKMIYRTPALQELIARWMDKQKPIQSWNDIKALGMFFKPQMIVLSIPLLFAGWLLSIALVGVAFPIAIAGGLGVSFMKMSKIPPVRWIAAAFINVIRGTPLFLQIVVAFTGLRMAGIRASDFVTGVIVLAINSSAYLAEIFRAGIQSIHKGQFEAASSLGMTYWQAMRYVIIPQTVKRVLPTMTSEFILLFKDTSLLAPVGVFELMLFAQNRVARGGNLTPFVIAAAYYLIVTIPLINWVGKLERRLAVSEHGQTPDEPKRRGGLFGRWAPASAGPVEDFEASVAEHESR
jgi:His/Glu/Gln/Arg/opine family amino acid ABC transporter permease subunit